MATEAFSELAEKTAQQVAIKNAKKIEQKLETAVV